MMQKIIFEEIAIKMFRKESGENYFEPDAGNTNVID
jgi:hypothetical protein